MTHEINKGNVSVKCARSSSLWFQTSFATDKLITDLSHNNCLEKRPRCFFPWIRSIFSEKLFCYSKGIVSIAFLKISEFRQHNWLLFPLKSSENLRFSDDFRENRSQLIRLNSVNNRSELCKRSLHTSPHPERILETST